MCPSCSYNQCKSYKLGENCQYSKVLIIKSFRKHSKTELIKEIFKLDYIIDNPASLFFSIFMTVYTVRKIFKKFYFKIFYIAIL